MSDLRTFWSQRSTFTSRPRLPPCLLMVPTQPLIKYLPGTLRLGKIKRQRLGVGVSRNTPELGKWCFSLPAWRQLWAMTELAQLLIHSFCTSFAPHYKGSCCPQFRVVETKVHRGYIFSCLFSIVAALVGMPKSPLGTKPDLWSPLQHRWHQRISVFFSKFARGGVFPYLGKMLPEASPYEV